MARRYLTAAHTALLLFLCGVLYFPYLHSAPFFTKGEPREAMAVQDIVRRGEWLVPLKRATDVPSKPPLFHWAAAATSHLTGNLDEATVRFPSAVFATLGVLLLYFLGRRLFSPESALLAAIILATTMIYQDQAIDARVDMTLCFFVTLTLVLFYALYRGFLSQPLWYYVFFAVAGIGTLAKGPVGLLLPALVTGIFLLIERRWDTLRKFCFHPGVVLMLILAAGWYVIAVTRGGEGFFDRQIVEENLNRFTGGSGHSHAFYYYIPYLFSQGLPWSIFLPVVLWDWLKKGSLATEDTLFFKLWFAVMFVFFSVSVGKRPVYLLPLYPAVAVLTAVWLVKQKPLPGARDYYYRAMALLAGFTGLVLLLFVSGALWSNNPIMSNNPTILLRPIEPLLKPKDWVNFALVGSQSAAFGWRFVVAGLLSALLWFSLARSLWLQRLLAAVPRFVLITIVMSFIARAIVVPKIAETRSYRLFMFQVNQLVRLDHELYLYRNGFNSDQVVFYRGEPLPILDPPAVKIAASIGKGDAYLIMARRDWRELQEINAKLPPPLLESDSTGPEGDAPLVLVRIEAPR